MIMGAVTTIRATQSSTGCIARLRLENGRGFMDTQLLAVILYGYVRRVGSINMYMELSIRPDVIHSVRIVDASIIIIRGK